MSSVVIKTFYIFSTRLCVHFIKYYSQSWDKDEDETVYTTNFNKYLYIILYTNCFVMDNIYVTFVLSSFSLEEKFLYINK